MCVCVLCIEYNFDHVVCLATETMEDQQPVPLTPEQVSEACSEPCSDTAHFRMQQTMMRIRDPVASLDFYSRVLGMRLLKRLDFADMKFTLYFMGYESREDVPETEKDRTIFCFTRRGTIELTHNWGTESDPNFEGYCNGNTEPGKGFGHIGIEVPDVDAACKRFENLAVKFVKKPNDGKIKGIAFIQDPDGYWIEVLNAHTMCRF